MTQQLEDEAKQLTTESGLYHYVDFNDFTHRDFIIKTEYAGSIDGLCRQLNEFCDLHGLPKLSADELLYEVELDSSRDERTRAQLASWLKNYIWIWYAIANATCKAESEAP